MVNPKQPSRRTQRDPPLEEDDRPPAEERAAADLDDTAVQLPDLTPGEAGWTQEIDEFIHTVEGLLETSEADWESYLDEQLPQEWERAKAAPPSTQPVSGLVDTRPMKAVSEEPSPTFDPRVEDVDRALDEAFPNPPSTTTERPPASDSGSIARDDSEIADFDVSDVADFDDSDIADFDVSEISDLDDSDIVDFTETPIVYPTPEGLQVPTVAAVTAARIDDRPADVPTTPGDTETAAETAPVSLDPDPPADGRSAEAGVDLSEPQGEAEDPGDETRSVFDRLAQELESDEVPASVIDPEGLLQASKPSHPGIAYSAERRRGRRPVLLIALLVLSIGLMLAYLLAGDRMAGLWGDLGGAPAAEAFETAEAPVAESPDDVDAGMPARDDTAPAAAAPEPTAPEAGTTEPHGDPEAASAGVTIGETAPATAADEPETRTSPAAAEPGEADDAVAEVASAAPVFDAAGVEDAVRAWAAAWSAQDVDAYLASYTADFRPESGLEHEAWRRQRRQRVVAPRRVDVQVRNLRVEELSADRARARFQQLYVTDAKRLSTGKTFDLVRHAGEWKIARERVGG